MFGAPKMKSCPNCKKEMFYNYHYECFECEKCKKVYNYALQELRPIEDWANEFDEDDY